ncbi:MAG TPA: hypothetical protein VK902_18570 [Rubrobacter sp.]|nr:hypothetical protein [Rubrobacter sp.]
MADPVSVEPDGGRTSKLSARLIGWAGVLACVAGGVLWAFSPVGVHLSEVKFHTPNVFWKLFPSAPLLLLVGLVGLRVLVSERSGATQKAGFWIALCGLILVVAGDVGLYWVGLDDAYIMSAPAYRAFRLGLLLVAAGSILFGVGAGRDLTLPIWGALPFAVGALGGLISFTTDLGYLGSALWFLFGFGWAWLGLSFVAAQLTSLTARKRPNRRA